MVSLQPELLYSQKGAEFEASPDITQKVNYIDVPVLVHIDAKGLFFELGPQVGFLVAAKNESGNASTDIKPLFKEIDFGYAVGLGYQLSSGPGIGLRYNGGFINLREPSAIIGNTTIQLERRNSAFQLYLTYLVGGKK